MKSINAPLCCLLIAIVAANAQPMANKAEVRRNIRVCAKEMGVSSREAVRVLKGNFADDSDNIKCFIKCMFSSMGFIDENDEIVEDAIREKVMDNLESTEAEELYEKCKITGEDICDTSYQVYKCIFENYEVTDDMLDF
ncbi:general odorant-binding protein 56d-like [Topomyia yanbarensis]|uniref:general odorant-binding protein 56d-like n=1 Tax=Topomyia yanbarensis TaxID=2498891 RepID=UPI00273CEFC8|nr:general odorant-binding protein 56d-like [Topomyia yanbarensis]